MKLTYDPPLAAATLSNCGTYRYTLARTWDPSEPGACFIMLNPSTADARQDDPTIRRCIAFTKRLGCGWLSVVNLFALRSTDPDELARHPDPIGPDNDDAIASVVMNASIVVCAWGAHPMARGRARAVRALLDPHPLHALGLTKSGEPRHPLYLRADAPLVAWPAVSRGSSRGSAPPDAAPISQTPGIIERANGLEPSTFSLGSKLPGFSEAENAENAGDLMGDGVGQGDGK